MAADDAHVSGSTLAPQIFLPNDLDHGITAIDHLGPLCRLEAWLRSGPAASPRLCRWALVRCCLVPNQHTLTTAISEARVSYDQAPSASGTRVLSAPRCYLN